MITIESAIGGFVVNDGEDLIITTDVYDLLHCILDIYGEFGRYDDERVYIIKAPGNKNEKFTEEMSNVIYGGINE